MEDNRDPLFNEYEIEVTRWLEKLSRQISLMTFFVFLTLPALAFLCWVVLTVWGENRYGSEGIVTLTPGRP